MTIKSPCHPLTSTMAPWGSMVETAWVSEAPGQLLQNHGAARLQDGAYTMIWGFISAEI